MPNRLNDSELLARNLTVAYVIAVVVTALALLLRWLLNPFLGGHLPFATFFAAIAIAAWSGGWRPALLATILGFGLSWYFFVPANLSFDVSGGAYWTAVAIYFAVSFVIAGFGEAMGAAQRRMRRARKQAGDQAEFLRITLASIADGVITTDAEGLVTYANAIAAELTGWPAEESVGKPLTSVLRLVNERSGQPLDNLAVSALHSFRAGQPAEPAILTSKNDVRRFVNTSVSPIRDNSGQAVGAVLVFRDITGLRKTEEELRLRVQQATEAEERMRSVVENVIDAIITIDESGIIQSFNASAERLFGYSADEVMGANVSGLMPQPHRSAHDSYLKNYVDTGVAKIIGIGREVEGRRKDGSQFPMELAVSEFSLGGARYFTGIVRDITARKHAEAALRQSEQRKKEQAAALEAILRATPTPIWIAQDPDCRVVVGNHAACRLLGVPEGTNVSATSPEELRVFREHRDGHPVPADELPMQIAAAKGIEVQGASLTFVFKDGRVRHVYGNAAPLRDAEGAVTGCVSAFMDVTELKEFAERLRSADRQKDEFLATLGHELRNPLAPIRNALEIFKRADNDAELLERARATIERQLAQLVRLIDDLLDISRITRNRLELRKERLELAPLIQHAVETCQPLADRAGQEVQVSVPAAPIYIEADPARLAQVFGNLLTNATKYTPRGGRISLTVERHGSDVVTTVKDTGIGIPSDKLESVFEMFTQVDRSSDRTQGGLGIGLTLVKRLVQMHQGTVTAQSAGPGKGSEFVVRLPALIEKVEPAVPSDTTTETSAGRPRRILVVDDSPDIAESLVMLLRLDGHETMTAHDGPTAVVRAEQFLPDTILLDIGLPKMNGYEVCRVIRGKPWGKDMLIVAMTGWGQEEDRRQSEQAGCNSHLVKPVNYATLAKLLADQQATTSETTR